MKRDIYVHPKVNHTGNNTYQGSVTQIHAGAEGNNNRCLCSGTKVHTGANAVLISK